MHGRCWFTVGVILLGWSQLVSQDHRLMPRGRGLLENEERKFACLSKSIGRQKAFLTYLDEGCLGFHPRVTNAYQMYVNKPDAGKSLEWEPEFVEMSVGLDFGISSGPWRLKDKNNTEFELNGHYLSVWQKGPKGWRVFFDTGVLHPKTEWTQTGCESDLDLVKNKFQDHAPVNPKRISNISKTKTNSIKNKRLIENITAFRLKSKENLYHALNHFASKEIRIYRTGHVPSPNNLADTPIRKGREFEITGSLMAPSGDLAAIWGEGSKFNVLMVWKKLQNRWVILCDLEDPVE